MASEHKFAVSQCCCCCTLRTGSIVIGVLDLLGSASNCGLKAYYAGKYGSGALWFEAAVYLLLAIVAILLLNGIRTSTAKQVWVWVWVTLVLTCLILIGAIATVVQTGDIGVLIGSLVGIALMLYFLVVVRSYAFEVESGGGASGNTV